MPNISPVISGVWSFKVLKFKFSIFSLGSFSLIALSTLFLTPNLSAKTIFFFLGFVGACVTSSAAISTLSDTSSVNSSPNTLLDASIALAGKYLFI